jgi:hypothetical protein
MHDHDRHDALAQLPHAGDGLKRPFEGESMKPLIFCALGFAAILASDYFGSGYLSHNSPSQHVTFSDRPDRKPNMWPFELMLTPSHKDLKE